MERTTTGKVRAISRELNLSYLLLEIANSSTDTDDLLIRFIRTIKTFIQCEAIGIRLIDDKGNIPFVCSCGFSIEFYKKEKDLTINQHPCLCAYVISGELDPSLPFVTDKHSVFINSTSKFLASTLGELDKPLRSTCHKYGYESIALIPIISPNNEILGLIHIADSKKNVVPREKAETIENSAKQLGAALLRIRMIEKLNESESRLQFILDSASDIIWRLNTSTNRFTYCSPAVTNILGYTPEEIYQLKLADILTDESLESALSLMDKSLQQSLYYQPGQISSTDKLELEMVHKNGYLVFTEASMRIYRDPVEGFVILGSSRDVTERTIMEQEKILLERQLNQAQKMEAIGVLAAGIAHDFNNLLSGISGFTSLAIMDLNGGILNSDRLVSDLSEIQDICRRAANITKQMLGLARKGKYYPQVADPNTIVAQTCNFLKKGFASNTPIRLCCYPNSKGFIKADTTQLHQALNNLAVNARDAMPEGGIISISTEDVKLEEPYLGSCELISPGEYVVITIKDAGTGISPDAMSKLFDPFFTTKDQARGTGLGLAQVWGIVHNHGAFIDIETSDKGTLFKLYFPATNEAAEKLDFNTEQKTDSIHGLHILVVDDEQFIRDSLLRLLTKFGAEVEVVSNGLSALEIYKRNPPKFDLVLTDVVMQPLEGSQLFRAIRKLNHDARVLLMSGNEEDSVISGLIAEGAKGFLHKPFDFPMLLDTVVKAMV